MNFQFSKHSIEQIKIRGLSIDIISELIENPDKTITHISGTIIYQKLVNEDNKYYIYRVFINKEKKPPLVITAYKTSKIEKYEDQV